MRTRPRVLAIAALAVLAAGCEADPVGVTVKLSLDPESCTIGAPDAVVLSCAATAGVWLRGGADGAYLDQACVDFTVGVGADPTLALLPSLLGDVALTTTSTDDVWVEVAVYGRWSAAQGCQAPDDLAPGDAGPEVIVSGSSTPAALSGSSGAVEVVLRCTGVAPEPPVDECDEQCTLEEDDCFEGVHAQACEVQLDTCLDSCTDESCDDACFSAYDSCLSGSPDGLCSLQYDECTFGCDDGDDACVGECDDQIDACFDESCSQLYGECFDACAPDGGSECAAISP
ncbi:MAG TPA: hypothetical protein VK698_09385 [Kofleriaceae bacterium]|nr:hypothetical protein [Kofleriaceae bacterium]